MAKSLKVTPVKPTSTPTHVNVKKQEEAKVEEVTREVPAPRDPTQVQPFPTVKRPGRTAQQVDRESSGETTDSGRFRQT